MGFYFRGVHRHSVATAGRDVQCRSHVDMAKKGLMAAKGHAGTSETARLVRSDIQAERRSSARATEMFRQFFPFE